MFIFIALIHLQNQNYNMNQYRILNEKNWFLYFHIEINLINFAQILRAINILKNFKFLK